MVLANRTTELRYLQGDKTKQRKGPVGPISAGSTLLYSYVNPTFLPSWLLLYLLQFVELVFFDLILPALDTNLFP